MTKMLLTSRVDMYHGGGFHENGFKRGRGMDSQGMKFVENNDLVGDFLRRFVNRTDDASTIPGRVICALIVGKILLQKGSPNRIQDELVTAPSKSTFYRDIHRLAMEMPGLHEGLIINIQKNARMAMRPDGYISIDEHVIPHTSTDIEGAGYFYSTSEDKNIIGMSLISTHYYDSGKEYPVFFKYYRKKDELEKWHKESDFLEKNQIARELVTRLCALPNSPKTFLLDSFFMTKLTVKVLQKYKKDYVSRPKRNWVATYLHKRQSLADLYDTIPADEFKDTTVINPKTKKEKTYKTAIRDAFFASIGTHRIVFIDAEGRGDDSGVIDDGMVQESTRRRKFRVFITGNLTWDAAKILSTYAIRWTIETNFRDMSQNLGLHGCQWQTMEGQYCFTALTFMCYAFLMWVALFGMLVGFGDRIETIGEIKAAFIHYCQDQFSTWLAEIRVQCKTCPAARFIDAHVYSKSGNGVAENL